MNWCSVDLRWAYGDLLRSITRQTGSLDRAYDILHDSLLRFALVHQREPIRQPHAYLRTVVGSVLADHGRDAAHWMPFPDSDDHEASRHHPDVAACRKILEDTVDPESFAPSPERLTELRERLLAAQRILDCLPPRCREAFRLYRIEGYTQVEVAAKLGITLKVVQRHLVRALFDIRAAREAFL